MKLFLTIAISLFSLFSYSQKITTLDFKVKDSTYTLKVGDTLHFGYGSLPNGNFMYILAGASSEPLPKEHAKRKVVIYKIKYFKNIDQYYVLVKGKMLNVAVVMPHAIDKREIVGLNSIVFFEE